MRRSGGWRRGARAVGGRGEGGGGGFDIMCLSWGLVVVREYSTGRVDVYDTVLVSYCAVR